MSNISFGQKIRENLRVYLRVYIIGNIIILIIGIFVFRAVQEVIYKNDDLAPYTRYEKSISIEVNSVSSKDLIKEISNIALQYRDDITLRNAKPETKVNSLIKTGDRTIKFEFCKYEERLNSATNIKLFYNMLNKKVEKIEYEQGHSRRVSGCSEHLDKNVINSRLAELFGNIKNN